VLTTAEALDTILAAMPELPVESVSNPACTGRILRQTVRAERDQPPFDRVMMDGIAIRHADFAAGQRQFPIQDAQHAGDAVLSLAAGTCIEVMTGTSLPEHADCIIPVERIEVENDVACIEHDYEAREGQFIHARASDHAQGAYLLTKGRRLTPLDAAVIAAAGLAEVEVSRQPVIRVISTGNELVPAGVPIEPHQVRLTNGPAIEAMLSQHGYHDAMHEHLPDDRQVLLDRIGAHLDAADILVLSGGVSMGKADFVPEVLGELGVEVLFHGVSQRPGKPMWFGRGPRGQAVFALPGNPVSALVCCRQYVIPALERASAALPRVPEFASLAAPIAFPPRLTCFQPVRLISNAGGTTLAMPVKTNTSGDLTSLSSADGYVELPLEMERFETGMPVRLHRWLLR
jgi:molybdopterin molybdotransferase